MKRKMISLLLALAMVLSMVSVASAQETAAIDVVEVTVGEAVAGQAVPAVTVPEGANYTADEVYWYDSATGESVTELADGGRYQMSIHVYPKEGYALSDETVALLNGEEAEDYWYDDRWGDNYITIMKFFSFQQIIDDVDLIVGEAAPGQAVPEVKVPEGVNYALKEALWLDEATGESVSVLADGKRYELRAVFTALDGYAFNEDWMTMTINGSEEEVDSMEYGTWDEVALGKTYSYAQHVERIDVSYAAPEEGKPMPVPSVAADAPYVMESWTWYDECTWEEATEVIKGHRYFLEILFVAKDGCDFNGELYVYVNGEEDSIWAKGTDLWYTHVLSLREKIDKVELSYDAPEVGKPLPEVKVPEGAHYSVDAWWYDELSEEATEVEDMNRYYLNVDIIPDEGYEFVEDAPLFVNGAETEEGWIDVDWGYYSEVFSFLKTIDKVELPGAPEDLQPGDSLEIGLGDWGDVNYTLDIYWVAMDDELNETELGDTAEAGKNYRWVVEATAKLGYEFAEDVEVTVGGQPGGATLVTTDRYVLYSNLYLLGDLQLIDKVELTVTAPAVGEKEGKLELADDALCQLLASSWAAGDGEDMNESEAGAAVQKGQYVWAAAGVSPAEGYIFSPEVEIWINGEKQDDAMFYWTETGVVLVYGLGQVGVEAAPPTGDAGVALYAVLAVMALCGMAVVIGRKKTVC